MEQADIIIYHSRDLDGLASGAVLIDSLDKEKTAKAIGYHYGEPFDSRKCKSKRVVMADVSMEMKKMLSIAKMSKEFIWMDHHKSAHEEFLNFCEEEKLQVLNFQFNGWIDLYAVKKDGKLLMEYYYSSKLAACEIALAVMGEEHSFLIGDRDGSEAIHLLGQYDTWRNTEGKQLMLDKDWDRVVLPFQYGMRLHKDVWDVLEALREIGSYSTGNVISRKITEGKAIIEFQKVINAKNMAFVFPVAFRLEDKVINGIALNGGPFNSQTFESIWDPEKYDFMMPFAFQGIMWNFSLYTTKEDVDILAVAKIYGGGGHKQACGFQVLADKVSIDRKGNILIDDK